MVSETEFFTPTGAFSTGKDATHRMLNSVMFKLSYHRAGEVTANYDYTRRQMISNEPINLKHFEEAYTSRNWIVRIYKVKPPENRQSMAPQSSAPPKGHKSRWAVE